MGSSPGRPQADLTTVPSCPCLALSSHSTTSLMKDSSGFQPQPLSLPVSCHHLDIEELRVAIFNVGRTERAQWIFTI